MSYEVKLNFPLINRQINEDKTSDLLQIEVRYIQDIVAYYSKEYYNLFVYKDCRDISGIRNQLMMKLEQVITKRLYETRLVKDYSLDVIVAPVDLVRDVKISNLLDNTSIPINQLYVKFDYTQHGSLQERSVMIAL